MIEIQDSKIIRDGEAIGTIVGDVAYVSAKPAPRIVGQIREAAGMPQLTFTVGVPPITEESSEVQERFLIQEQLDKAMDICRADADEIGVTVDIPEVISHELAPVEKQSDLPTQNEKQTFDLSGLPEPSHKDFKKAFINNYGPDMWSLWQKENQ